MMDRKNLLLASGVVTGIGCAVSIYFDLRRKKRDKLAAELIKEITKQLKPSTTGLLSENAFDIHYKDEVVRSTGRQILTLKSEVANDYANQIHSAWGSWWSGGDDEKKVYGVFRKLRDKVQVSQIATAYLRNFGVNLIDKLNERLNDKEIKNVLAIVKPLPAFRTV
ncbi:hypothetical protein QQ008_07710 [Fulvivirgaceae bacterium BMA10]|uniref:Uncharacterized protein n=1 Tax=Splendidivirga corallicola TaxID=3051826 RepID=A0ABT8KMI2_9BACT|nr:hypothetical protein [Fulvivirgaceae bacterium BMA10]